MVVLLASVVSRASGQQDGSALTSAGKQVDAQLDLVRVPFDERKGVLFSQYVAAIERIAMKFQQAGDLQNVIDAKAEADLARKEKKVGEKAFPAIDPLRVALDRELALIEKEEKVVVVSASQKIILVLTDRKTELTRDNKLNEALEIDALIKRLEADIELLKNPLPVAEKIAFFVADDCDPILANFDPKKSLARELKMKASSFYAARLAPKFANSPDRKTKKFSGLERIEWAMKKQTGWLQADWEEPVEVKYILLMNRLTGVGADPWVKGRILVNGTVVGPLNDFGGKTLAYIELKEPVMVKSIRLEALAGKDFPGISYFEVYSRADR